MASNTVEKKELYCKSCSSPLTWTVCDHKHRKSTLVTCSRKGLDQSFNITTSVLHFVLLLKEIKKLPEMLTRA